MIRSYRRSVYFWISQRSATIRTDNPKRKKKIDREKNLCFLVCRSRDKPPPTGPQKKNPKKGREGGKTKRGKKRAKKAPPRAPPAAPRAQKSATAAGAPARSPCARSAS